MNCSLMASFPLNSPCRHSNGPKRCILGPTLIFSSINDLDLLKTIFTILPMTMLCGMIHRACERLAPVKSPLSHLDKINWSAIWNMTFNVRKSHTLILSTRIGNKTTEFISLTSHWKMCSSFYSRVSLSSVTFWRCKILSYGAPGSTTPQL